MKIIQILILPMGVNMVSPVLYALGDDGSIWWRNELENSSWQRDITPSEQIEIKGEINEKGS